MLKYFALLLQYLSFCSVQGDLRYKLVGDGAAADYFEVSETSGDITIKRDLMKDFAPYYIVSLSLY